MDIPLRDTVSLNFDRDVGQFDRPVEIDIKRFFHFDNDFTEGLMALEWKHSPPQDDGLPANMDFVAWL